MSSDLTNVQKPEPLPYLASFEEERNRYKPKDMIDFSIAYFKALQKNEPLNYWNLCGLEEYKLHPEDEEVIFRLEIPDEDLRRVIERRQNLTNEQIYENINKKINEFGGIDPQDESAMFQYQKFKTNSYKENEFLRFIDGIEKCSTSKEENRIYFTKLFHLNQEEKQIVFKFMDNDYNLNLNPKIKEWKNSLERLENTEKHTYHPYDKISFKLEEFDKCITNNQPFVYQEFTEVSKEYIHYIEDFKNLNSAQIYDELIKRPQFEREIIYLMAKIMNTQSQNNQDPAFKSFYEKIDEIYTTNFSKLTKYDFYDYVLGCFIPLIKNSNKTSIEHKEMESFLNAFLAKIPNIIHIGFLEEKKLLYNIECIKYFLIKDNRVKELGQVLIDIIKMLISNINYLLEAKNEKGVKQYPNIINQMKQQYELINLQLKEFYGDIVTYINKVISITTKHDIDNELDIKRSLISEFKSNSLKEQQLILNSLRMSKLFETEEEKQIRLENTYKMLSQVLSIPEKAEVIQDNSNKKYKEVVDTSSDEYYLKSIKNPKYNFKDLEYVDFSLQSQVISLIIRNNKNLKNNATSYEKEKITPNMEYALMIEKLFNFNLMFFKLFFEKDMKEQLKKDGNDLINQMQDKFKKEYQFIDEQLQKQKQIKEEKKQEQDCNLDCDYDIEKFKTFNKYQQKLILTFLNFCDNFNLTKNNYFIVKKLSVIYLQDIVDYIRNKILKEKNLKDNAVFLNSLYSELKHVDYPIFIYVKYDRSNEFLNTFDAEHKEIVKLILQTEALNPDLELPNFISITELLKEDNNEVVQTQLQANYPLVKFYIDNYDNQKDNKEEALFDFRFFRKEEKLFIVDYLKKKGKDISIFEDKKIKPEIMNDLGKDEYRKIILCECDEKATEDIKIYYRKKLLEIQKYIDGAKQSLISCVLNYPYDPNNNTLYEQFLEFYEDSKYVIVQSLFAHLKVLNNNTLYFDYLTHYVLPNIFDNLLKLGNKYPDNEYYHDFIQKEFDYLLKFFSHKLSDFIHNVLYVDHMTIFKYTRDFSERERDIILYFLDLYSFLKKDVKYTHIKENLDEFKKDLSHNERIQHIKEQIDQFLNDQSGIELFMLISEEIKETFFEVDFILQSIVNAEGNEIDEFTLKLFKSLDDEIKEIVLNALRCINKLKMNERLNSCIDTLQNIQSEKENFTIYETITKAFKEAKNSISSAFLEEKEKKIEKYEELKQTLNSLCSDLFLVCDDCKLGLINLRKLKAISKEKFELIKLILDCEYACHKNSKLKGAIEVIKRLKFE